MSADSLTVDHSVDAQFMRQAIELAAQVDLARDVNPRVGAVIVSADGAVVSTGIHQGSGTDHAEAVAVAAAGDQARGATVYVTLEPCAGTGKRPPCVNALIAAQVATVVYGQADPNQQMAGGAKLLTEAGIEVRSVLSDECTDLNPSWTFAHKNGRPWVVWKTATTLDGFISVAGSPSPWITGEAARADVQALRRTVGAIVTGTGTVLADDPLLTVRELPDHDQPLRVIVGSRPIPETSSILQSANPAIRVSGGLAETITNLWHDRGIHRVLVEAGQGISTSLWQAELVDEVYWYQAPTIGAAGIKVLGDIAVKNVTDLPRFSQIAVNRVGLDVLMHFTTGRDN
ncbi:MAG: bifunctional diaminohydroxyphosphoribosylaminopyrimidine deaminase/5-amino-6-(5-phosphoribosylamino)uracil reductase RibD [Actinomycetales bacterium]|nr:bifunctional diaminohydroxyphosphoribosylaminopyrimidine deaminase/5-amino-6-(5-phosphoribosylamino)uracil reductase RibD [Actinomycetales bacterium]